MPTQTFMPFRTLRYLERIGNNNHFFYRGITTMNELFEAQCNLHRMYFIGVLDGRPEAFGFVTLGHHYYSQIEKRVLRSLSVDVVPELVESCDSCRGQGKVNIDNAFLADCGACNGTGRLISFNLVNNFTIGAKYDDMGEFIGYRSI
jgi:hypothetical protein